MTETIYLRESERHRIELTKGQLLQLKALREELKSDKIFWKNLSDQSTDGEYEEPTVQGRAIALEEVGNGWSYVTIKNAVGILSLQGLTLVVSPKIGSTHFNFIASRALGVRTRTSRFSGTMARGEHFHEIFADWFLVEVESLLRFGLQRDYLERTGEIPFLRGRVNTIKSAKNLMLGRLLFESRFETFEIDNAVNRVIKSALNAVLNCPEISAQTRGRATRALGEFRGIRNATRDDLLISLRSVPTESQRVFSLSLQVLRGLGRALDSGRELARSFLLPTPAIIEAGIREILKAGLAPTAVEKKSMKIPSSSYFSVNPDLLLGESAFTGDVKYKLSDGTWSRNDLAQGVMFAAAFRAKLGFVINFCQKQLNEPPWVRFGDIEMKNVSWNFADNFEPEDSAKLLVSTIKAQLEERKFDGVGVIGSSDRLVAGAVTNLMHG